MGGEERGRKRGKGEEGEESEMNGEKRGTGSG